MIIKLTEVLDNGYADRVLYVNVNHIETMWVILLSTEVTAVTAIQIVSGKIHWVRETPAEILDM